MNRKELKSDIENKFGSMSNFSKLAKANYRALRAFLNEPKYLYGEVLSDIRKEKLELYTRLCKDTRNDYDTGKDITDQERLQLYIDVVEISGSVQKFCDQFNQWPYDFVNNVVSNNTSGGSKRLKRKTKRVCSFIEFVNNNKV